MKAPKLKDQISTQGFVLGIIFWAVIFMMIVCSIICIKKCPQYTEAKTNCDEKDELAESEVDEDDLSETQEGEKREQKFVKMSTGKKEVR